MNNSPSIYARTRLAHARLFARKILIFLSRSSPSRLALIFARSRDVRTFLSRVSCFPRCKNLYSFAVASLRPFVRTPPSPPSPTYAGLLISAGRNFTIQYAGISMCRTRQERRSVHTVTQYFRGRPANKAASEEGKGLLPGSGKSGRRV